jgi:acyl-CoA dehydrogenase
LSQAGLRVPAGTLTVAPVCDGDKLLLDPRGNITGRANAVPFAREVDHIVFVGHKVQGRVVALVRARTAGSGPATISQASRATGSCASARSRWRSPTDRRTQTGRTSRHRGRDPRAAQMSGALQAILDRSVAYANRRVAFERPISKFQVIQHNLARLAGESAAALAAAGSAADTIDRAEAWDETVFLEVAAAKIRVGEAATEGAAIAHQVHGAIGFSGEHALHRFTQRLWAWRDDFGSESAWAVRLGKLVAAKGVDALWPMLATR